MDDDAVVAWIPRIGAESAFTPNLRKRPLLLEDRGDGRCVSEMGRRGPWKEEPAKKSFARTRAIPRIKGNI